MTRPYKPLSERLLDHIQNKSFKHLAKDDLDIEKYKTTLLEIDELIKKIELSYKNNSYDQKELLDWSKTISNIKTRYSRHFNFSVSAMDESNVIDQIETASSRRALLYRILTTAGIGITVMGVYALAHYLNIPMPLMRIPL